jgi:hypothetical protein
VTTIRSLSLRIFPSRTRCTYAVTWRTQRGTDTTDRRLYWGDVPIGYDDLDAYTPAQLIEAISRALTAKEGPTDPAEGRREPLGAVGGGPGLDQRLPGVDGDD